MYARQKLHSEFGNNITAHQTGPSDLGGKMRDTNTFKSNIAFNSYEPARKQEAESKARRDRQFVDNPVQPGATR